VNIHFPILLKINKQKQTYNNEARVTPQQMTSFRDNVTIDFYYYLLFCFIIVLLLVLYCCLDDEIKMCDNLSLNIQIKNN